MYKKLLIDKCAFCGKKLIHEGEGSNTKSEEHIIPFSLGNEQLVLERGIICDQCNNYFALKIEKPFLELDTIKLLRSYHLVESRKKHVPPMDVYFMGEQVPWVYDKKMEAPTIILPEEICLRLKNGETPQLFFSQNIDLYSLSNNDIVKRMLAKIFLEILLYYQIRMLKEKQTSESICFIYDEKIKKLIDYVRYGNRKEDYQYTVTAVKKTIPFQADDFVARITLLNDKNWIMGMHFLLFELEFYFYI